MTPLKRPIILLVALCVLLFAGLPLVQYAAKHLDSSRLRRCGQCGMSLSKYERTQYEIRWADGTVTKTCGVQCGLTQHILHRDRFQSAAAKDYFNGRTFDARNGYYVLGSRVLTDMAPGFIAFQSLANAEGFQKESGGELMNFEEALSAWGERKVGH